MAKSKTEVLVVGAGPAGLLAAREAAHRGAEVLVLEEHETIGFPNHCAGVLSIEGLNRLKVEPSSDFVQNQITGGRIYSPAGVEIEVRSSENRAYVVDRTMFDKKLSEEAARAGAEILLGWNAERLRVEGDRVTGAVGRGWEIESKIVIDAEGAAASLARPLGLIGVRRGVLSGVNCDVSYGAESHLVEVWLGRSLAPGFFAWVIPVGEGKIRCGLACSHGDPVKRLEEFMKSRLRLHEFGQMRRGFVLTGGPALATYMDGLLLAGDVAGQTKATTGGGVILGGLCAMKAGEVAGEAVSLNDSSSQVLSRYEDWWRDKFGREFSAMSWARRVFDRLSDEKLNELFSAFKSEKMESVVQEYVNAGDMDFQRGVITIALRDQRVVRVLIRVLGRLIVSELKGF